MHTLRGSVKPCKRDVALAANLVPSTTPDVTQGTAQIAEQGSCDLVVADCWILWTWPQEVDQSRCWAQHGAAFDSVRIAVLL